MPGLLLFSPKEKKSVGLCFSRQRVVGLWELGVVCQCQLRNSHFQLCSWTLPSGLIQVSVTLLPTFFSSMMPVSSSISPRERLGQRTEAHGEWGSLREEDCNQPCREGSLISHASSFPPPTPCQSGNIFLMVIFKKCLASAHLQIILSNLHNRSRRPQLHIRKMEYGINMINGLGQLTATVATVDPQAPRT
jgi:hypothetical protein